MTTIYRSYIGLAALAALAFAAPTHASILFDADGTGAQTGTIEVGSFGWDNSTVLSANGNLAVSNFLANIADGGQRDTTFTVLNHARLSNVVTSGGATVTPTGLNADYEITMVIGFQEQVTNVVDLGDGRFLATFSFLATGESNFFEMWYSPDLTSNSLQGTGFNDGDLILSSEVVGTTSGNFTSPAEAGDETVELDQFTPSTVDGWEGQLTETGSGSQGRIPLGVELGVLQTDPEFFKNELTRLSFANLSLLTPFAEVSPSFCFVDAAGGAAVKCIDTPNASGLGAVAYDIGNVNGALPIGDGDGEGGTSFIFQTRSTLSADGVPVPEPATLGLLGLGLIGIGAVAAKRRRRLTD